MPFWYSYPNPKTLHPQGTDLRPTEVVVIHPDPWADWPCTKKRHGKAVDLVNHPLGSDLKQQVVTVLTCAAVCDMWSICAFLHCNMFVCKYIYMYMYMLYIYIYK